jgi:hypothetical protein
MTEAIRTALEALTELAETAAGSVEYSDWPELQAAIANAEFAIATLTAEMERPAPEPVAWRVRFHTDDSLRGLPNVRSWQLTETEPKPSPEWEVQPLYAAPQKDQT